MAEPKNRPIMINLEPSVSDILQAHLTREGMTVSAYGRSLIIEDLRSKGLLTDEMMLRIFTATGAR